MITGLSLQDINQIELELLEMIDYNLNVGIEEQNEYMEGLNNFCAQNAC